MSKLAIIMPVFNASSFLEQSITSILEQTYTNFDFYIVDDNSDDNSFSIMSNYKDKRIFISRNKTNLGISQTLNNLISKLKEKYEFLARMDADDWAFPDRLEQQMKYLDENKEVLMCGTQGYWTKDFDKIPDVNWLHPCGFEAIKISLLFSASFGHSSIVIKSSVFDNELKYNTNINTCEDWDLWTRIVLKGKVENLPYFLMKYRIHQFSNHRDKTKHNLHLEEKSRIIANYWSQFGIDLTPKKVLKLYYSTDSLNTEEFVSDLKLIIKLFNQLNKAYFNTLNRKEKKHFRYRFNRFVLSFWKRTNSNSRKAIEIWLLILINIKYSNKYLIFKNMF